MVCYCFDRFCTIFHSLLSARLGRYVISEVTSKVRMHRWLNNPGSISILPIQNFVRDWYINVFFLSFRLKVVFENWS